MSRGSRCHNEQQKLDGLDPCYNWNDFALVDILLAMSKEDSTTSEGRSRTVGTPASFCRQRAEVFITCMKNVV